jgi:hypothetical protein
MRRCAAVRLRRYTKQRSRSKVRARVLSVVALQFSAQCTEAVLDTLYGQDDDTAATLILRRRHGHRGLAADPWPRKV